MILSIYPCSHPRGCVLSKIDAAMNAVRAANVKHPWAAPQSWGDEYYRVPTPEELRAGRKVDGSLLTIRAGSGR